MIRFVCALRLLTLLLVMASPLSSAAGGNLRVLAWPGYAEPDVVKAFEQRTGSTVEVTFVDSDEVLWERINGGQVSGAGADGLIKRGQGTEAEGFDVFAVNTAELQRYLALNLVRSIPRSSIPNLSRLSTQFRELASLPGVVHAGEIFGIPYAYAEMGLIYNRNHLLTPPTSIAALWDSRLQGRVLAYNGGVHNFSLAAQSLGLANPYQLREEDWPLVVKQLVALRRNVLAFYSQPAESVELFMRRNASLMLANYGSQQLKLLREAGANVGYAIPVEGALAWLDCWAVLRTARNPVLAEAWINYLLEEGPGLVLQDRQGLSNTTSVSPHHRADERLLWLEPVGQTERRNQLWERIHSGYSTQKVLAP